ncbi:MULTISPECIES: L-aspartate oxidase [unclassified Microbacterium]|uniref:L-aspartate oxidase n=1 Tax=unclassified Microbacterium TaxID=2609290 RepID=UPI00214B9F49|nr:MULTISPECIES: L-aspartate oxidase [unclassified Microbacterium]MCR2809744.1 L-aspartate oxidase [Microbacterium sp. zg.B185]WIM17942.1 L-aspartate oxidase [Microbacterium sp. zg-B185]
MTAPVHAIVVGSGIAGLTVALHALGHGCRVTLVTKDVLEHANTRYAQGGIAGVMFDDDRAEDHLRDTLTAGAGLGDPAAVRVLVEEGPARIRELIALGVAFDRGADGAFVKGLEAAHSYPRILHSGGDATGTAIEKALVARLRASSVRVLEHAFLVDLVRQGERITGVDLLIGEPAGSDAAPTAAGRRERIHADAVVLATGGAGELYAHTTNPAVATADGIAAALRAGADVTDLEFFQFHPTVLEGANTAAGPRAGDAEPGAGGSFLVSEAVRGEGATLIDETGRRFAFDAHPDGELAPRDVVARAIARQMEAQGGRPVFLDATHLRPTPEALAEFLARRFPTIDRAVRDRGLDWSREPIPVTPAAHYLMGGVRTDLAGRTSIPGLYAVGEVARTGVHGANRLASNSLLEGAVFGARAGDAIAADAVSGRWTGPAQPAIARDLDPVRPDSAGLEPDSVPRFSRAALQELMWEHAGLVRDAAGLEHAGSVLASWRALPRVRRTEAEFEDENLLLVAEELVRAALRRRDSLGAHFRRDDLPRPDRAAVSSVSGVLAGRGA